MTRHPRSWVLLAVAVVLAVLAPLAPGGAGAVTAAGGQPAPVRITFKSDFSGRVISDRAACVRHRDVYGFNRTDAGVSVGGQTTTDNQGRYPTETRRGGTTMVFTLVLGNAKCRIAQSGDIAAPFRAGAAAGRSVSLEVTTSSLRGKVTAARQACVRKVPIQFFGRPGPGSSWFPLASTSTDRHGRYALMDARRRGSVGQVLAAAIGDEACRVAQSPTRNVT